MEGNSSSGAIGCQRFGAQESHVYEHVRKARSV